MENIKSAITFLYWGVIVALVAYQATAGLLQSFIEHQNAKREERPQEQKSAQNGIWTSLIAIILIVGFGAGLWLMLINPMITKYFKDIPADALPGVVRLLPLFR